jgi:hypothetical protein
MVEVQVLPRRERLVMVFRGQVLEEELEQAVAGAGAGAAEESPRGST